MNKKEKGFWERYLWSVRKYGLRSIYDAYKNPSDAKMGAWERLARANPDARFMTVVSVGCQTFSVGWLEQDKNGNWGFKYQTACQCYEVPVTEEMKAEAFEAGVRVWKK